MAISEKMVCISHSLVIIVLVVFIFDKALCIRHSDRIPETARDLSDQQHLKIAIFALGSFWRSEAIFGCLPGVVRTTVGYAGGSKTKPEYRNVKDHAESVQNKNVMERMMRLLDKFGSTVKIKYINRSFDMIKVLVEYNPRLISFKELLDVFWSSHDPRQVFGQGPDVGNQYRSIIFTNGTEESRLAAVSKEKEQTRSRSSVVTTQIQQLGTFYPAEPEHQKFELKQNAFLLHLIGSLPEEELERSSLATKLNGYAAELCPPNIQKHIDTRINEITKRGWPLLREL